VFIFFLILYSCDNEEENQIDLSPCLNEECSANFWIDPLVSPGVYEDENGYWHIEHQGYNYFTIQGELSRLKENYEINGVPLVSTAYDSNYWIWIDGITFTVPLYSLFGFFISKFSRIVISFDIFVLLISLLSVLIVIGKFSSNKFFTG